MSQKSSSEIAMIGIDIGKNSFHVVGQDRRRARVDKIPPIAMLTARYNRTRAFALVAFLTCKGGLQPPPPRRVSPSSFSSPRLFETCLNTSAAMNFRNGT